MMTVNLGIHAYSVRMPTSRNERLLRVFAKRLRTFRARAGFRSAERFAKFIGIEPHTYRKYERGDVTPNLDVLGRICASLEITPNDLLPELADFQKPSEKIPA
jgi:transcriptional regulator with XRE-family HTH domain